MSSQWPKAASHLEPEERPPAGRRHVLTADLPTQEYRKRFADVEPEPATTILANARVLLAHLIRLEKDFLRECPKQKEERGERHV